MAPIIGWARAIGEIGPGELVPETQVEDCRPPLVMDRHLSRDYATAYERKV